MKPGDKRLTVELPEELVERLRIAAEERVLSVRVLVEFLLEDGLEHLIPIEELRRRRSDGDNTDAD